MRKEKIKLNIINPQESSLEGDIYQVAEFFDLLLTWHIEEQRTLKAENQYEV